MANKFDGDVRPLSNDPRYMGLVFRGSMKRAASIARAAKEFPLPEQPGRPARISRDRWNLLEHLNLSRYYTERKPPKRAPRVPSRFSLEHAQQRWPENFHVMDSVDVVQP